MWLWYTWRAAPDQIRKRFVCGIRVANHFTWRWAPNQLHLRRVRGARMAKLSLGSRCMVNSKCVTQSGPVWPSPFTSCAALVLCCMRRLARCVRVAFFFGQWCTACAWRKVCCIKTKMRSYLHMLCSLGLYIVFSNACGIKLHRCSSMLGLCA